MIEQLLVVLLFLLLLAITGGILYITWVEFRDRRRRKVAARPSPTVGNSKKRSGKSNQKSR